MAGPAINTPYTIRLAGRFGGAFQLDAYSDDIHHLRRRLAVDVDLSGVTYMKPVAVIGTMVFIETVLRRGRTVNLHIPEKTSLRNYLMAIGLREALEDVGTWEWEEGLPYEAPAGLRTITKLRKFAAVGDVERIGAEMEEAFMNLGMGNLLAPSYTVFAELADNVLTHAGAPGYVLAQRYEYKTGPVIDIAVGDCGIGLRAALEKNPSLLPKVRSDRSAVELAMQEGVSGLDDPMRGFGLHHVNQALAAPNRVLAIRSGSALGYWREGLREKIQRCGPSIGTLVHAAIPS